MKTCVVALLIIFCFCGNSKVGPGPGRPRPQRSGARELYRPRTAEERSQYKKIREYLEKQGSPKDLDDAARIKREEALRISNLLIKAYNISHTQSSINRGLSIPRPNSKPLSLGRSQRLAVRREEFKRLETSGSDFTVFESKDHSGEVVGMTYFSLRDGGSATLIKNLGGRFTLLDCGTKSAAKIIYEFIQKSASSANVEVDVRVTHLDADHIGGLPYLLELGANVRNVLVPKSAGHESTIYKLDLLSIEMRVRGFRKKVMLDNVVQFSKDRFPERPYSITKSGEFGGIRDYTLEGKKSIGQVSFKSYTTPKTSNQHSLMHKFSHKGKKFLDLGDIDMVVIRRLVDQNREVKTQIGVETVRLSKFQSKDPELMTAKDLTEMNDIVNNIEVLKSRLLKSSVFQWPHHQWFPKDIDLRVLDEFIREVGPEIVIVTNPPKGVRQSIHYVKEYFEGFNSRHNFNIKVVPLTEKGAQFYLQNLKTIRLIDLLVPDQPYV